MELDLENLDDFFFKGVDVEDVKKILSPEMHYHLTGKVQYDLSRMELQSTARDSSFSADKSKAFQYLSLVALFPN